MRGHDLFRVAAIFAVMLCYSTILLGGNVMASNNGLACPDWPSCFGNGNFLPALHGGVIAEWGHRVSAFFLSASILVLAILGLAFERKRQVLLRLGLAALALVVGEALLGGLVVENQLESSLVITHLGIATVLFGVLLVVALLANLRELPARWIRWARQAAEEQTRVPGLSGGVGRPAPGRADPAPERAASREA